MDVNVNVYVQHRLTRVSGATYVAPVRILDSAHRHDVENEDIEHALTNAIRYHDLDEGLVMVVGPTRTGDLIEVGVVVPDEDEPYVVHAMAARQKFI